VRRLFADLSTHVDQLVGAPIGVDPGFMDRSLTTGARWAAELVAAAGTCQVFVPLVSSAYAKSKWCTIEREIFAKRRVRPRRDADPAGAGTAILPVTWLRTELELVPAEIRRLQFFEPQRLVDPSVVPRYLEEGVYGLLALNDESAYQAVTWRLAQMIVRAYERYRVEPHDPDESAALLAGLRGDDE
jgi:hypothetical protein